MLSQEMRKPDEARDLFNRVIEYLYAREADSQSDNEDKTLTLRMVALAWKGIERPYELAFSYAFGTNRQRFLEYRAAREWEFARAMQAWEKQAEQEREERTANVLPFRKRANAS